MSLGFHPCLCGNEQKYLQKPAENIQSLEEAFAIWKQTKLSNDFVPVYLKPLKMIILREQKY